MSFFSRIGLSIVDKVTGNALDKLGNAIKDGDVTELVKQFTGILEGVEDKLGDVGDLFEDAIDDAKKDVRREVSRGEAAPDTRDAAGKCKHCTRSSETWWSIPWSHRSPAWSKPRLRGSCQMAKKKPKKKPVRGSGFSVTLPTEPIAGAAKDKTIMAVMVQDDGAMIMEYEIKLGNSISFRVGGSVEAFMERVGPAPDSDMFMDAHGDNAESVTVEYEHALVGPQDDGIVAGASVLTLNAVVCPALEDYRTKLGVEDMKRDIARSLTRP